MRYLLLAVVVLSACVSCNKDKYTSAPQIKFKSITPRFSATNLNVLESPVITLEVTDAEGDIGFKPGKDTSYVYVKNLTIPPFRLDSFKFPQSLSSAPKKNFKGDAEIAIRSILSPSGGVSPYIDTLYFEVYIMDFAKHKSNVIKTDKPLLYTTP